MTKSISLSWVVSDLNTILPFVPAVTVPPSVHCWRVQSLLGAAKQPVVPPVDLQWSLVVSLVSAGS